MLIIGDLSGIQEYLFDVAHAGGGQARRLRARSFFVQLLAESAALRITRALNWSQDHMIFCGAGKFILDGPPISADQIDALAGERVVISRWLLKSTGAQLRFSLAVEEQTGDSNLNPLDRYNLAMMSLQKTKLNAWADIAIQEGKWETATLVLAPLDTPCVLCRRRTAEKDEEIDGELRKVCVRCHEDREFGRLLPRTHWIGISSTAAAESFDILDLHVSLSSQALRSADYLIYTEAPPAPIVEGVSSDRIITRQLNRHIPLTSDNHPMDFSEIAEQSRGDKLLGILKADADSLGVIIDETLKSSGDLSPLGKLSKELDGFFGGTLALELRKPDWKIIYTIFAGGDDLLLIGPWNVIVDFAAHVRQLFQHKFGEREMTISAAVAFVKPSRPIKFAAEQAEHLLQEAKTKNAYRAALPKDQIAAFGQIWKWQDHETIIGDGKHLAKMVNDKVAERGWLQTLLEIGVSRQRGDLLATSRLAYHVGRNYPKVNSQDPSAAGLRRWANRLINDLDDCRTVETTYLPAIVRYALTATRGKEERLK